MLIYLVESPKDPYNNFQTFKTSKFKDMTTLKTPKLNDNVAKYEFMDI